MLKTIIKKTIILLLVLVSICIALGIYHQIFTDGRSEIADSLITNDAHRVFAMAGKEIQGDIKIINREELPSKWDGNFYSYIFEDENKTIYSAYVVAGFHYRDIYPTRKEFLNGKDQIIIKELMEQSKLRFWDFEIENRCAD